MSAISSPSALFTTHANSTPINILSILRIGAGVGAFIAPAFFTQRALNFKVKKTAGGVQAGGSVGHNTTQPGDEAELTVAVRLYGARDLALGLLLRDTTAAVVTRALQVGVIVDALDTLAAALGYIEGTLSREVATSVGTIGAVATAFQLWILNR